MYAIFSLNSNLDSFGFKLDTFFFALGIFLAKADVSKIEIDCFNKGFFCFKNICIKN